jgi:DNA helicase-2/ATP-dependent DNA helicase PcrA
MNMDLTQLNLNASQLEAVKWQDGALLVLAGPGSGKTRVLTCRVARLIADSPGARFRVLGVTFTNKAATEMRNRIDTLVSDGRDRATLTTFHSFAAELLRQHGSHIGLKPDFSILSEPAEREAVLSDAIKSLSLDEDFAPTASQVMPLVTRMLDGCVAPADAERLLVKQPHAKELAAIYAAYRRCLIAANQMDFATLLAVAVDLLENKPAIAKLVRRTYSYVCVDECQDTNTAQFRLLVQLVPEHNPNLFIVADDDQLIYQWNGASPARLQDLRDRFKMPLLELPENYRCPPAVIALANNLIQNNQDRSLDKKPLEAHKTEEHKEAISVRRFSDFTDERRWLADCLSTMDPQSRADSVILARRKKLLEDAVETLAAKSVPAYIAIRKNEYQSAPYRWLHATLRLANAQQDREQLRRMTKAFFQLEGINVEVDEVVAAASVSQSGFLRTWRDIVAQRPGLDPATSKLLAVETKPLIERLDYWPFVTAAHEWFTLLQGRQAVIAESAFVDFTDEREIWNAVRAEIATHYDLGELSLHNFLQEVDLRAKEKPAPKDAVRCLTIAASKGMEFKHVFLIGMVEDELPGFYARKKGDSSDDIREERRNCFVAITRAEDTLTLTYSDRYYGYTKSPSRFLREMGVIA